MAQLRNIHDPQWVLFPVNNDRTAWRPYGMPVILVVPHRRDPLGFDLPHSNVWGVRVYVENVPQEARVAGHDHIGMRFPDRELYAIELPIARLEHNLLVPESLNYVRDGQAVDAAERLRGDFIRYTCSSGVTDDLPYLPDADYYDLSDVLLEVELLPPDRYNLVYEARFYARQRTQGGLGDLLCIDVTQPALGLLRSQFNHPGEVLREFYNLTPPPYLDNTSKAKDKTVALYRPFTDAIQDVADEQLLLEKVNWVHEVPYEAIPYLSSLLGWEIPFFPESLDQLRRVVLRNTSRLQSLKGSRRALTELFRLLGLEILVSNLWWAPDGRGLRRPVRNPRPGDHAAVGIDPALQIEPLLVEYASNGFGELTVPLLHRPQVVGGLDDFAALSDGGDVTVDAYLVEIDGPADLKLRELCHGGADFPVGMLRDPDGFTSRYGDLVTEDRLGRRSGPVQRALEGMELGGYSQLHLTGNTGTAPAPRAGRAWEFQSNGWGRPPLTRNGVTLNRDDNALSLVFNGYFNFSGQDELPPKRRASRIYAFATYTRQRLTVPAAMRGLQSNRFDIQLLAADTTPALAGQKNYVDPTVFEFAFEFLHKIKAFHSLLNVLRFTVELTETYETTTTCVGGDILQRWDTDMGRLQVPPAKLILPPSGLECTEYDPERLGYQHEDILLRLRKLANLPEEFEAWKALDQRDRAETYSVTGPRLAPRPPAAGRGACKFTTAGQDRVVGPRVERYAVEPHPAPNANSDAAGMGDPRLCPAHEVDRGSFDQGRSTSTLGDSHAYGRFMVEGVGAMEPWCVTDGVSDYCYKGRVDDELLYRPTLLPEERYRPTTGTMLLGHGVYWTYPAKPVVFVPGTVNPGARSRTVPLVLTGGVPHGGRDGVLANPAQAPYLLTSYDVPLPLASDNFLGRLYRDYSTPHGQSLHFSNRNHPGVLTQTHNLALQRPELGIEQPTMHFPGCRFLTLNKLGADLDTGYRARPWDDQHSTSCGPAGWCDAEPGWLGARLAPGPDGEVLIFDDEPLIYGSTGRAADIPSLGDHGASAIAPAGVVHTVLTTAPAGHPAVTLDRVTQATGLAGDKTKAVSNPMFNSAVDCSGGYRDFADGYPGETGVKSGDWTVAAHHGITFQAQPGTALFLLGDGVLDGVRASRWDGGCLAVDCGEPGEMLCGLNQYYDQDGDRDWGPDQVWVEPRVILQEQIGVGSMRLDGQMGTLFELMTQRL